MDSEYSKIECSIFISFILIYSSDIPNSTKLIQLTTKETVVCSANTTVSCNYSWIRNKDDMTDHDSIVDGEQLNLEEPGSYSCKATCDTSAQKCIVYPMRVDYVLKTSNEGT